MKINEYLTSSQAAQFLGVSKNTLFNWEKKNILKAYRNPMNNYRLYKKEDLERLLDDLLDDKIR